MVDEEGKKEEKVEFDSAGEAFGYISLDQATLLAIQTARDDPGDYGRRFESVRMVFEVVGEREGEDSYVITLSLRPAGDFQGTTGQEQFFIQKEGAVAHRQVLSLPRLERGWRFPVLSVAIGLVVVAVAVSIGGAFATGVFGGGGDGGGPATALAPTKTPVPTATATSGTASAPTALPTPTFVPNTTPLPTALPTFTSVPPTTPFPTALATFTPVPGPTPAKASTGSLQLTVTPTPTTIPTPTSTPLPATIPVSFTAAMSSITVDGDTSDWSDVVPVSVRLQQIRPIPGREVGKIDPIDINLRVASDGERIYVLVEVPDDYDYNTEDHKFSPALAVMFRIDDQAAPHMGATEEDMSASLGKVDIWHWQLDCGPGVLSGGVPGTGGNDQLCNFDDEYSTTPSVREDDVSVQAENSLAGMWEHTARNQGAGADGIWIFEMSRRLFTGDPDDAQLTPGGTTNMALAFWDADETADGWTDIGHLQSASGGWIEVKLPPAVAHNLTAEINTGFEGAPSLTSEERSTNTNFLITGSGPTTLKAIRVILHDGNTLTMSQCRVDLGRDCVSSFNFSTGMPGTLPTGTYLFVGLDAGGTPIPGIEIAISQTVIPAPDPPINVQGQITENGIEVTWNPVDSIPGYFDPSRDQGSYDVIVKGPDGPYIYGGHPTVAFSHVISLSREVVSLSERGSPIEEWGDGVHRLSVVAESVKTHGLHAFSAYSTHDPAQDLLITIKSGAVVSIEKVEPAGAEVVTFPDANLDAVIRGALGKLPGEDITAEELAGITNLDAWSRRITDLTGIEYCIGLTNLVLNENLISDISPVASLSNLTGLHMNDNQARDISPLASLNKLTNIHVGGNQISDISSLAALANLTWLSLAGNQISDITPLAALSQMAYLELNGNQLSDISSLASLTNLASLDLNSNQIYDISPLVENVGLGEGDEVWLEGNELDLWLGSEDQNNIQRLQERGVIVHY
jgi:hypothetical protein